MLVAQIAFVAGVRAHFEVFVHLKAVSETAVYAESAFHVVRARGRAL